MRDFKTLLLETIYPGDKILLTCKKFEQLNQHMYSNKCGQSLQPVNRENVSFPSTYKSFKKMTACNSRTQRKAQQTLRIDIIQAIFSRDSKTKLESNIKVNSKQNKHAGNFKIHS